MTRMMIRRRLIARANPVVMRVAVRAAPVVAAMMMTRMMESTRGRSRISLLILA